MWNGKTTINFYNNTEFNGAFGKATVYFQNGSIVGFSDTYDFNPQPWGNRSTKAELATRSAPFFMPDGKDFNIYGGNQCRK
jgi:hypothetical protein